MNCKVCGSDNVKMELTSIPFKRVGLDNVILKNVQQTICETCNNVTRSFPKYNLIIKQIRLNLVRDKSSFNGKEFSFLRDQLKLNGTQLSELLGVTNVSVSRWENGAQDVPAMADRLIRALTLSDMKSNSFIKILKNISAHQGTEDEAIYIDVSDFQDPGAFASTSAYGFGSSRKPATVYTNMNVAFRN
ncbi:type II toxin-antitoxin system MqsA family antitoxin [Marinobacter algicola]|uniref:type II toxin-antitoxin system MqsA family antitoxin n=1 Tax=Marinobacter algicola TaxID=236100 RepID=UPI003BABE078